MVVQLDILMLLLSCAPGKCNLGLPLEANFPECNVPYSPNREMQMLEMSWDYSTSSDGNIVGSKGLSLYHIPLYFQMCDISLYDSPANLFNEQRHH